MSRLDGQVGMIIPLELKRDLRLSAARHGRAVAREAEAALRYWLSQPVAPVVDLSLPWVSTTKGVHDAGVKQV